MFPWDFLFKIIPPSQTGKEVKSVYRKQTMNIEIQNGFSTRSNNQGLFCPEMRLPRGI